MKLTKAVITAAGPNQNQVPLQHLVDLDGDEKTALQIMEQHLAGRDFFALKGPSIADFSLAGYIFFVEEAGLDLKADYPAVAAWRDRIAALPGWKHPYDLMPGHPLPGKG